MGARFLLAAGALKTPARNGYRNNAQGVNLIFSFFQEFTEEFQNDLSGLMYKSTADGRDPNETAREFCSSVEVAGKRRTKTGV